MIAAIYARKSTEQHVADDQKSVARQVSTRAQYAARKGWTVDEAHIYVDDGISGAEFAARPAYQRLLAALKPRPPFHVLVMSESSRLGREAWETGYALKQLLQAGVRVFFYLEDRECTFDHPLDKLQFSLVQAFDEMERTRASQRATDKALSQARAGHVTGGRVFGYDNVVIDGPHGQRSHVERRVNEAEAAIVRRIFELAASGVGQGRIARLLNEEGVPTPRPQRGRPQGWAVSSVHEVLFRPLYRGELVWNRTRKRDRWGQKRTADRPSSDWICVPAPALRIVPEDLVASGARANRCRSNAAWQGDERATRQPAPHRVEVSADRPGTLRHLQWWAVRALRQQRDRRAPAACVRVRMHVASHARPHGVQQPGPDAHDRRRRSGDRRVARRGPHARPGRWRAGAGAGDRRRRAPSGRAA